MALAARSLGGRNEAWPMTLEAFEALEADALRMSQELARTNGYTSGHMSCEPDAPVSVKRLSPCRLRSSESG